MPIAVSILISDDEMAIVYHSGVGGCIAAMMNERSGVPETPSFPSKKYPRVQEDVPWGFELANLILIYHGSAVAPFLSTAAMIKEGGGT